MSMPVDAIDLIGRLDALGVRLSLDDGRLLVDAPLGAITAEIRETLRASRDEIISRLNQREAGRSTSAPHRELESANGTDGDAAAQALTDALLRLRAGGSRRLQHWEDDRLRALVNWHLALAFGRAGRDGFRRHIPASMSGLSDDDLAALTDWDALATLEKTLWRTDPESAARMGEGVQRLAAWWNARRGRGVGSNPRPVSRPDGVQEKLHG